MVGKILPTTRKSPGELMTDKISDADSAGPKRAWGLFCEGLSAAFMLSSAFGFALTVLPWVAPILVPTDFAEGRALVLWPLIGGLVTTAFLLLALRLNRIGKEIRLGTSCNSK